jgi:hypothetical protein
MPSEALYEPWTGWGLSAAPALGGGVSPVGWLRMLADIDHKRGAHKRALEAEALADWLTSGKATPERAGYSRLRRMEKQNTELRGALRALLLRGGERAMDKPVLSSQEHFLLDWLGKEEACELTDCHGMPLDRLVAMGLVGIAAEAPGENIAALTGRGWLALRALGPWQKAAQ